VSEHDVTFRAMGCEVRLIIGAHAGAPDPAAAACESRAWLADFDARLSRFRPDSELCSLNADRRETVPASTLLRAAVSAGVWAAQQTGGLVDPTLVDQIERAGYVSSRDTAGVDSPNVAEALRSAPPRLPASRSAATRWRQIRVDDAAGTISRPPGIRFDTGGTGKGLAADALAHRLARHSRVMIDCGGDVRVTGRDAGEQPITIEIEHPLTGDSQHSFALGGGAVATSGIARRIWRTRDGFAHHLLDPATGRPAWTGLIQATALAPTALEAETLAKAALLSGPAEARRILSHHGGAIVHDDGGVELLGALELEALAA
jgi:thiamine biosynthesis lipoprotein